MKKITLNLAVVATILCSPFSIAQTITPARNSSQATINKQHLGFELTDATKDCIANTGFARCLTDENEIALQKENPSRTSEAKFKKWLKPHIEKIKADRAAGKLFAPTYNIPVVIHIAHNGDAVGAGGADWETRADVEQMKTVTG